MCICTSARNGYFRVNNKVKMANKQTIAQMVELFHEGYDSVQIAQKLNINSWNVRRNINKHGLYFRA